MFIKNFIKVFGAVIGSAIVLPLSFGYSGALMLANTFKGFGSSGDNEVFTPELQIALFTIILVFSVPVFTVMNYVKPENDLRVPSSVLVILAGLITSFAVVYKFNDNFTWQVGIVILCCLLILISGFLQLLTKSQK